MSLCISSMKLEMGGSVDWGCTSVSISIGFAYVDSSIVVAFDTTSGCISLTYLIFY